VQAEINQWLCKKHICRKQRAVFPDEAEKIVFWVFVPIIFGVSNIKFAEKQINTFRWSGLIISIYPEGFPTKSEVEFQRTSVNVVSFFSGPCYEASRRTAAEQKSSPLRSEITFMLSYPLISELRIWDPVTLSNLVSIGNNQWNQVGIGFMIMSDQRGLQSWRLNNAGCSKLFFYYI
jgi:hypothetical protein